MLREYMVSAHTSSTYRRTQRLCIFGLYGAIQMQFIIIIIITLTLTLTHTITAYSVSGMSYVCAYSSVQLDKSRVEKEFT